MTPLPVISVQARRVFAALLSTATLGATSLPTQAEPGPPLPRVGLFGVHGSGTLRSETRSVGSFSAVEVHSSVNVVLRQGQREAVELRGDDNLLALVDTLVVNRSGVPTLQIRLHDHTAYSSPNPITLTVDVVTLSSLSVRGSGNVSGDGLKAPALTIAAAGSGNVKLLKLSLEQVSVKIFGSGNAELAGQAGRLDLSIAGSGGIDTRGLQADDVSVSVAGSGDASVNARKTLSVSIAGSGDVEYRGDAVPTTSIAGSDRLKKR